MSKKFEQKRFGRYLLLDHLVDGGMAAICRARFLGEQANKIVAIKMIQEKFSKDEAFVQMFRDELRVTFGLIHPNIAQTYDYGEVDNTLYTAMEYVDGANLKQYLDRLKKRKFIFPVEISTYIISQVCQALTYAHTYTDKLTGKSYNIVHRDISPHNIMLTYDGAVKVIDFGIAKAETNSEETQAGTIKGKLSYLAPEYLEGMELDHRYDQFAVGITLWEMLCSKKLFTAKNDLAVLKKIQSCEIPVPSSINPNVPAELDKIVMKALSKSRDERFKNMDAFNRALVRFLYSTYPDFNATDLSFFAKELFKDAIQKDSMLMQEYGRIDLKSYINDYESSLQGVRYDGVDASTVEALIVTKRDREVQLEIDPEENNLNIEFTRTTRRNNFSELISKENEKIQNILLEPTDSSVPNVQGRSHVSRARANQSRTKVPRNQPQRVQVKTNRNYTKPLFMAICLGAIAFLFSDFDVNSKKILDRLPSSSKNKKIAQENTESVSDIKDSITASSQYGTIRLKNYSPDMDIFINGEKTLYSPFGIKVPLDEELIVKVSKKNHTSFNYQTTLSSKQKNETVFISGIEFQHEGIIKSDGDYPDGTYLVYRVNGERQSVKFPFDGHRVPAGSREAIIYNKKYKIKKRIMLNIQRNKYLIIQ